VRAPWAWNFALDETLYGSHRDLAVAVRTGNATQPPSDLRFWLAATMSLDMWTVRARDGYVVTTDLTAAGWQQRESGLWSQEPELTDLPRTVISTPPFVLVLADAARDLPLFDTGPWLTEAARSRRPVPLLLPTVEVHQRPAHVVRFEDIVLLELQI
jgi:hypothetical protein